MNDIVKQDNNSIEIERIQSMYARITKHIGLAKQNIQRSINTEMVRTYFLIGKEIVEEEQQGENRAAYGKKILQALSAELQKEYKRGFSVDTLEQARKFFLLYADVSAISDTVCRKSDKTKEMPSILLSWSHYRELIRIDNPVIRNFYEIESISNNWSVRELIRQRSSLLFERLSKGKNKDDIMRLASIGHEINNPADTIKDPLILEFLDLPESHLLVESKLEEALIQNLQHFLLELGKGFAFVARQRRLTLDNDHYYADLVFYHMILKCYVVIDVKTHKLTHNDLGQIQLYVNYFDQNIRQKDDNPTIGLILCTEKNEEMVKYTLGDQAKQIFASKYQLHLPTEEELEVELKRELAMIKHELDFRENK